LLNYTKTERLNLDGVINITNTSTYITLWKRRIDL